MATSSQPGRKLSGDRNNCGEAVSVAYFSMELSAWGPDSTYGYIEPDFCSREHLIAYFAEDKLPPMPPARSMTVSDRAGNAMGCLVVLALFVVFSIGAGTLIEWIVSLIS
jgi:hypothetical protein